MPRADIDRNLFCGSCVIMFKSLSNRSRIIEAMPITEASEEELLAAAMQYNEAALGELYDRYEAKIYSYLFTDR